jgi:glyoxylase-like metal-dependent hydrolase (beta-lactamase superfamily II)
MTALISGKPDVKAFFDARTSSVQYVVSDPRSNECLIIDPVFDYDEKSGAVATCNADLMLAYVAARGLKPKIILDTHPHADHFSAAQYLKEKTGAPTAIGEHVVDVQRLWKAIYNLPDLATDGSQWDRLFAHGDRCNVGDVAGYALYSPGHALASVTYVIGDAAFVHDTLFMPDSGTARGLSARKRVGAVVLNSSDFVASQRNSNLHRPRLSTWRPRAVVGDHSGAAESAQPARQRDDRRRLRSRAPSPRPNAAYAEADFARATGQHLLGGVCPIRKATASVI